MDLKNSIYWFLFKDMFDFLRTHYPPSQAAGYWEKTVADAAILAGKYKGKKQKLCSTILNAILDDLAGT